MPPATPVAMALPPILPTITSCRGPMAFFHTPIISTGTGSAVLPLKTVQAVACMPGFTSLRGRMAGLPALGGESSAPVANGVADTYRYADRNTYKGATSHFFIMGRNHLHTLCIQAPRRGGGLRTRLRIAGRRSQGSVSYT